MKNIKAFRDIIKESQINAYNDGYKQGHLDGHKQGQLVNSRNFITHALKMYFTQQDFLQSFSLRYKKKTQMNQIHDSVSIAITNGWEAERYREVFEKVYSPNNTFIFDRCSSL